LESALARKVCFAKTVQFCRIAAKMSDFDPEIAMISAQ